MHQQSPTTPIPASPSGSVRAPRRTGPLVAALVVGLLSGAAVVGAAWAITGDGTGTTSRAGSAATDASGACDALAGFDESKYTAEGDEGLVALNRWSGAVTLSAAAGAGDPAYTSLSEALSRARHRHARVFDFDAEVKKDLAEARRICAGL